MDTTDYTGQFKSHLDALFGRYDDMDAQTLREKHACVLALARAGATDLAVEYYTRFGLDAIKTDEDIMALAGRLSKDRYFQTRKSDPRAALNYARDSAAQYEAAFQATGGFYSGVNAATMALAAQMPEAIIYDRAKSVRDSLPPIDDLPANDLYFIEATRAECLMLLGQTAFAKMALDRARHHDPLNYTAHAATLKQLRLIAEISETPAPWLDTTVPPRALHFAGHIFHDADNDEALCDAVTDMIQKHDIGFGYGALAAGSDIIIAEALRDQGAELHVTLPVSVERFRAGSVVMGREDLEPWGTRFDALIDAAISVTIAAPDADWPRAGLNAHAAHLAMGFAVMKSQLLGSDTEQLLISTDMNIDAAQSYTAQHGRDWQNRTGKAPIIIAFTGRRPDPTPISRDAAQLSPVFFVTHITGDTHQTQSFDRLTKAMSAVRDHQSRAETAVLYCGLSGPDHPSSPPDDLINSALPGAVITTLVGASLISLHEYSQASINKAPVYFAGLSVRNGLQLYVIAP